MKHSDEFIIRETSDFKPLSELFHASGLEVEISEQAPEHTLKMWRADDPETGKLLAAATIEHKNGCFVVENLAVEKHLRGQGLGKTLLDLAEQELTKAGAERIWGCAKVPAYYLRYGWQETERQTAPNISHCQSCPQFGTECFPSIIYKDVSK